ncbi:mitochondrial 54S ribosomal protein YmL41 [Coemansia spiralis]|nr:mitochondrial 54S ribosomal protein YmL41 [Coemansia spiralis]
MAQRFGSVKIYFPNIVFKIIPDTRLSKFQAAFRVPLNINKLDIKDYLTHIYNVTVTDVRTVVFPGKLVLNRFTGRKERASRTKKAIVTMKKEFTYPPEVNVDHDFGGLEKKYEKLRMANKMRGWTSQTPEMEKLYKQIMEKRAE